MKIAAAKKLLASSPEAYQEGDIADQAVYRLPSGASTIHVEAGRHRLLAFRWNGKKFIRR
jgi:hypothetical protein